MSAAHRPRLDLRALAPALAGWALLAVVGLPHGPGGCAGVAMTGVVLVALGVGRRHWRWHPVRRLVGLVGATLVLLGATSAGVLARDETGPVRELGEDSATARVTGRVQTDPHRLRDTGGGTTGATEASEGGAARGASRGATYAARVLVTSVSARGRVTPVHTTVLVLGDDSWQRVPWHAQVSFTGRLRLPQPGSDVAAVMRARAPDDVSGTGVLERAAEHARGRMRASTEHLPTDARALVPALVIGDTSRTPDDLDDAMLATGMTHLSAVSGSNVSLVLAAALGLCSALGLPRRLRPLVAGLLLAAFVVLARPEPSVIRAAAMGAVGLIGLSTSRGTLGVPALSGAVVALLAWDPPLARSYGFALSTLATLGLLLFARPWGEAWARRLPRPMSSWGPALAVPVAAQLVCGPVIVLLQGTVSTISVLANLAAAPLVAPATVVGVATALIGLVAPPVAVLTAWGAALPSLGIAWVARTFARVPGGTLPWPDGVPGALLLAVLSLLVLLSGPRLLYVARARPLAGCAAVLLAVASALPTRLVTWPPAGWRFVACDVGEGDALVLASGPGHAVLVDAGPDADVTAGCLDRLGVTHLDAVVLTHFHADHVAGLPGALRGRRADVVAVTATRDPPTEADRVDRVAAASGTPVRVLRAGDRLAAGSVSARVWSPERPIEAGSVPNNASLVMTVDASGLHLLLTGDMEREAAAVVRHARSRAPQGDWPERLDVLKVAHHGSSNRDDELVRAAGAPEAVISVGRENDYGHPSRQVLATLGSMGAHVSRTDTSGDVAIVCPDAGECRAGAGLRVVTRGVQ